MLAVIGLHAVDRPCPQDFYRAATEPQVRYNARGCDHKSNVASVARLRLLTQGCPKTTPQACLWVLVRRRVLNVIPTRGVYSDYGVPIQMLYDKYLPKITKDTILIVMGDARGNRHDPKIYEFRAMCRKAKRAYWLNTEPVNEWDTADSDASLYGTYADMFETVNPKEIMEFIAEGVR